MINAYMLRLVVTATYTRSLLNVDNNWFHVLELPWKNNKQEESCIPAGEYVCTHLPKSASGKYTNVYHVLDVPGRSGILIHNGNYVSHTLGCLLIGSSSTGANVWNSVAAKNRLAEILNKQDFNLTIWGDQYVLD